MPDQSLLFELIRSFVMMAETKNLSIAAKRLGLTRPTLRRHLADLQAHLGVELLVLEDRQYRLSEDGENYLETARHLLEQVAAFCEGHASRLAAPGTFECFSQTDNLGQVCYSQRHGLTRIWQDAPTLLQQGLQLWTRARCNLGAPEIEALLPYLLIYRRVSNAWMCVAIGEKSSFVTLLGEDWARSSIGIFLHEHAMAASFDRYMARTYSDAYTDGTPRLDHIYAHIVKARDEDPIPVSYQRLLLPSRFPNGQPALAVLVARTKKLQIDGLPRKALSAVSDALLMDHVFIENQSEGAA